VCVAEIVEADAPHRAAFHEVPERGAEQPRRDRCAVCLGEDEIRYVKSGSPVTNFTIAVNRRTKQDDSVDHIDVVAWDTLAETSNAYLTKGMPVLVEGRLAIRSYESKSGEKHKAAEVIISLLQMLNRGTSRESNARIDSDADLELKA
jgi:single-strand DNA-binding protein